MKARLFFRRCSAVKPVKITVLRKARYDDLIAVYENPQDNPCFMEEGQVFYAEGQTMPEGFCPSAWQTLWPFVLTLSCGGQDVFPGWMKNSRSALLSCNDGFRPVSFLLECGE